MQKNKQWICYFIALFIFMSGMCFENIKADSLALCMTKADAALIRIMKRNFLLHKR